MPFVTVETDVIKTAGYQPALTIIKGTFTSSGGSTGGVISPGYNNNNGTFTASTLGSIGCRNIFFGPEVASSSASPSETQSVIAYDTTRDRFEITFTTGANQTGTYKIECYDNGA